MRKYLSSFVPFAIRPLNQKINWWIMRIQRFINKMSSYFRRKLCCQDKSLSKLWMKTINNRMYLHNKAKESEIERKKTKIITDRIKKINKITMRISKALKKLLKRSSRKSQLKSNKRKTKRSNSLHLKIRNQSLNRLKTNLNSKPNNRPNKRSNPHLRKNPNLHKANLPTMTIFWCPWPIIATRNTFTSNKMKIIRKTTKKAVKINKRLSRSQLQLSQHRKRTMLVVSLLKSHPKESRTKMEKRN